MREIKFDEIYNKLKLPVIVCTNTDGIPVAFLNSNARLLLSPSLSVKMMKGPTDIGRLEDILRFRNREEFQAFCQILRGVGAVMDLDTVILSQQDDPISVRINANAGIVDEVDYFFIYVSDSPCATPPKKSGWNLGAFVTRILQASYNITDIDQAIQTVLGLAGSYCNVSRTYVFEDIPGDATRNTYEWCVEGVEPAIDALQHLDKKDYDYDAIMNSAGMLITNDTSQLPDNDREILQMQGIKAIAILPLYHFDDPLGYIGFDDCVSNRRWTTDEIQLLQNVASVVSSLISRRNAERESRRGREMLQTVVDNLDVMVYVSDLDTHEIKFISQSFAQAVDLPAKKILGQPCWSIIDEGRDSPCPFCPLHELRKQKANGGDVKYVWERYNASTNKWYLVKDIIIKWLDDEWVHLCTYMDITYRKQYEEQLKHFASIDAMTDVFNRNWGYDRLEELFNDEGRDRSQLTLCFIDLDGLKMTNDYHGHAAGDEMIQETVRTILRCIRKDDFIIRWGGDEFVLLLNCAFSEAAKVMAKIRFGVDHFNSTAGKKYTMSFSYGLVDFTGPYPTLDELMKKADARMYENKTQKRGQPPRRNNLSGRWADHGNNYKATKTKSTEILDKNGWRE